MNVLPKTVSVFAQRGSLVCKPKVNVMGRVVVERCTLKRAARLLVKASAQEPSNAETAKTVASLVGHGTLSLTGADGFPVGCYAQFIIDDSGHPLLLVDREIARYGISIPRNAHTYGSINLPNASDTHARASIAYLYIIPPSLAHARTIRVLYHPLISP